MEASDSSIQGFIFLLASPRRRPSAILWGILVPFPFVFHCHEVTKLAVVRVLCVSSRKGSRDQSMDWCFELALNILCRRQIKQLPGLLLFFRDCRWKRTDPEWKNPYGGGYTCSKTSRRGTSRKIGWGVRPASQHPFPIYDQTAISTLFITRPNIWNPIYDLNLTSKSCFRPVLWLDP